MFALPKWLFFMKKLDGLGGFLLAWGIGDLIRPIGNPAYLWNIAFITAGVILIGIAFFVPVRS